MRSAGPVPSSSADTTRGETKASGASSRTCRSTFPSRWAITAKLAARPFAKSSFHWRALAIAIRRASRRVALIGTFLACCARAASGHATAAPLMNLMNPRRLADVC